MARHRRVIRLPTSLTQLLTGGQRGYQPRPARKTSKSGSKGSEVKTAAGSALRQPPHQGSSAKRP